MTEAHCRHCGYDLVGLGLQGRCPECGRAFDKQTRLNVDLDGGAEASQRRSQRLLAVGLGVLSLLLAGAGGAVAMASEDPLAALVWGLTGAGASLIAALWVATR